ncbi:hypothetical protein AB0K34_31485 [Actinomadura sp. NPDC049382]|uniref:hypothetical protein n=1 Tax=Actinomadura sp. NPDC049382 TaxID=3158220 RepID=UPI00342FF7F8
MRYTRVIPPVALLLTLPTACTHTEAPAFNPTPHPTHPAQAVVIAGSPELNRDPRDGEFALRSSAYGGGGLAVSRDGTLYYRVYHGREGRIVRLGKDGRIQLRAVDIAADQMFVQGNDLWLLAAKSGLAVTKVALTDWKQSPIIEWTAPSATVEVAGVNGAALPEKEARGLYRDWSGAKFFARADGTPIVVSRAGRMFEVVGSGTLREWSPPGYSEALAKVAAGGGLRPEDAVTDQNGQTILLGRAGLLYVPRTGKARYVRFPASTAALPPWSAMIALGNGDVLLLGGTTPTQTTPRPTIVRADGRMERLSWGGFKWCPGAGGGLATIASALPGGVVRRADGTIVLNDRRCGQVYAFKLPEPLSGTPFGR